MDGIHRFEADQPMLPFVFGWWQKLLAHAALFANNDPELDKGQVPPDKRKKDIGPAAQHLRMCGSKIVTRCGIQLSQLLPH
jgi:hypothetical protein